MSRKPGFSRQPACSLRQHACCCVAGRGRGAPSQPCTACRPQGCLAAPHRRYAQSRPAQATQRARAARWLASRRTCSSISTHSWQVPQVQRTCISGMRPRDRPVWRVQQLQCLAVALGAEGPPRRTARAQVEASWQNGAAHVSAAPLTTCFSLRHRSSGGTASPASSPQAPGGPP